MSPNVLVVFSIMLVAGQAHNAVIGSGTSTLSRQRRVSGAHDATKSEFPFLVSLQRYFKVSKNTLQLVHFCSGTIIQPRWIVTNIYCIDIMPRNKTLYIKAGKHNLNATESTEQTTEAAAGFTSDQWKKEISSHVIKLIFESVRNPNDPALIRLRSPLNFDDHVSAIKLPQDQPKLSVLGTFIGWGSKDRRSDVVKTFIQKSHLHITDWATCDLLMDYYHMNHRINKTNICTISLPGDKIGRCKQDSGGPLIAKNDLGDYELIGIASANLVQSCLKKAQPFVYANVVSFLEFIDATIKWHS